MSGRAPVKARRCAICTAPATHRLKWLRRRVSYVDAPWRQPPNGIDLCSRHGDPTGGAASICHAFRGIYRFRELR